ncbi:hypothetical protein [Flavobacterium sp.]|uniref:hypothetical protein n=1 Tax=Flavobacterium sp. TaxID=239 RepID=UPI003751E05C
MKNTIFDTHPNLDCYFETADGSCFFTENAAEAHSKTLEDKKVKTVHNTAEKSSNDSEEDKKAKVVHNTAEKSPNDSDDELILKVKELEDTELVKENYIALKGLVKYFQIEVADQKADTLIQALTDYKLKLQA